MTRPLPDPLRSALFRGLRFCFRLLPLDKDARAGLKQGFFNRFQGMAPQEPRGKIVDSSRSARAQVRSDLPALGHVSRLPAPLPSPLPATLIAFYLPQFHTIPENDAWWGKGFTEWRNVGRALPQFEGHAQPRLPADLGYYDLRNPQVMREQARMAQEYGIGAFCFYFYWFGGKTLLETPIEQWLNDTSIDLPYCLCWANENWSRRWDGREDDVLIEQRHSPQDDEAFIAHVSRYLRDPRYLRVDGKPLLLVYRPGLLPDAAATAQRWRDWCSHNGIGEIFIAYVQGFEQPDPREIGFDAAVEFPPNLSDPRNLIANQRLINPDYRGHTPDWRSLAADYGDRAMPTYRLFPGVNCGWDNEPRKPGRGRTYLHSSPRRYGDWLYRTVNDRLADTPVSDRFVFINAWNEWAEGAILEPDIRLGYAWLDATRRALVRATPTPSVSAAKRTCVVVHAWYLDTFDEILDHLLKSGLDWKLVVTTTAENAAAVNEMLAVRRIEGEVVVSENHGRDILPFLRMANRLLDEGEDVVLKLHTKKSPHLDNGDQWRRELLSGLVPQAGAAGIAEAFQLDPRLGLVGASGHILPLEGFWGANQAAFDRLCTRLGIDAFANEHQSFISGSMFWLRLEALRPLLDAHLDEWEFEDERGQMDGTLAHAIERLFCVCSENAGYFVADAASIVGSPSRTRDGNYPYVPQR